jgi:hypothetical protein
MRVLAFACTLAVGFGLATAAARFGFAGTTGFFRVVTMSLA